MFLFFFFVGFWTSFTKIKYWTVFFRWKKITTCVITNNLSMTFADGSNDADYHQNNLKQHLSPSNNINLCIFFKIFLSFFLSFCSVYYSICFRSWYVVEMLFSVSQTHIRITISIFRAFEFRRLNRPHQNKHKHKNKINSPNRNESINTP